MYNHYIATNNRKHIMTTFLNMLLLLAYALSIGALSMIAVLVITKLLSKPEAPRAFAPKTPMPERAPPDWKGEAAWLEQL